MGNIMGMRHPYRGLRAVVPALAAMGLAGTLRADLAPVSPFLAPNAVAAGAAAGPSSPIELRGLMPTPNGLAFCIFDTAKKKSVWIGMNETGHDFVVRSASPESDTISVDYQGKSMKLTLKAAKVDSAGAANLGQPLGRCARPARQGGAQPEPRGRAEEAGRRGAGGPQAQAGAREGRPGGAEQPARPPARTASATRTEISCTWRPSG